MKRFLLVILLAGIPLLAQSSSALDWEKLAGCLPQIEKVADLIRGEVTGGNDPAAYVNIEYYDTPDLMARLKAIVINIEDCSANPEYIKEMLGNAPDISKPFKVKEKYEGVRIFEVYDSVIEKCGYTFAVAGKFLISIESLSDGDFFKEIDALINEFDFDKMEKLK